METDIRVRFAPSPTGKLHIGTARVALFNYLFAKNKGGSFVLRIEDTDLERSKSEYEKDIIEALTWLGIKWDEGLNADGNYGPYRQSERTSIYQKYIEKLLEEEKAYYCFCSEEELEAEKQYLLSIGNPPVYNEKCSNLSSETVEKYLKEEKPSVIRFKTPHKKVIFHDLIRGKVEFDSSLIGDFVIAKDKTIPLYNFAVVIDDFEMKISHVIRGEDHISNTPKQILMQEALEFPSLEYAHLPLILGPDKAKLSKRDNVVSVSEYKEMGYLPETIVNFIAFLGWNPGTEREIYSINSLIKEFSLEKVQKGGAVFNIKRLDYLNGFYIRQKPINKINELCIPYLIKKGMIKSIFASEPIFEEYNGKISEEFIITETEEKILKSDIEKMVALYQERMKTLSEIPELIDFFFKDKLEYDKELLKWKEAKEKETKKSFDKIEKILSKIKEWNKESMRSVLMPEAEKEGDRGRLLWPFRVALTGKKTSADPFEIAEILGKEKAIKRVKQAKDLLK